MTADSVPVARGEKPFGAKFLSPLLLGAALNPVNSAIIATALVGIGHDLDADAAATASLVSGLYLASAIAQPTMGKLSDRFGARRVFIVGMVIVGIAGLIGGTAPNVTVLLIARVLVGIGTAAGYPTALSLIRRRAARYGIGIPGGVLGSIVIAGQVTASLGLPLGGVLVGFLGWRSTFIINVPLAILGIAMTLAWIPRDRPEDTVSTVRLTRSIDLVGIALFAGAIASLLFFLGDLRSPTWWLIPLVIALGAGLILWERRAGIPFIDVRMLAKNAPLRRTYLRNAGMSVGQYCVLYGLSQWIEQSRHLSPIATGLTLLPMAFIGAVSSGIVSRWSWLRLPLTGSGIAAALGGVLMLGLRADSSVVLVLLVSLLFGISMGVGVVGNQAALYLQSPAEDIAVASGLLRTSSYIGAVFSASLIGVTYGSEASDAGLHTIAWVLVGIGVALALAAVLDRALVRPAVAAPSH